jgi:hypothetical protein
MPTYGTTDRFTAGGAITAIGEQGTQYDHLACDDNASTYWAYLALPSWWKYDFGAGVAWKISKFTSNARKETGAHFKDFTISGSNDDSNWTLLYTGQATNDTGVQTFTFTNRNPYRYIKIASTTEWDSSGFTQIYEFEAFEGIYPVGGLGIGNPYIF